MMVLTWISLGLFYLYRKGSFLQLVASVGLYLLPLEVFSHYWILFNHTSSFFSLSLTLILWILAFYCCFVAQVPETLLIIFSVFILVHIGWVLLICPNILWFCFLSLYSAVEPVLWGLFLFFFHLFYISVISFLLSFFNLYFFAKIFYFFLLFKENF